MADFLARRWKRQPQGPVEIDWSNPLADGLRFAYCAGSSMIETRQSQRSVPSAGRIARVDYGQSIIPVAAPFILTEEKSLDGSTGLAGFAVIGGHRAYLSADEYRAIFSTRDGSNQGWGFYRNAAQSSDDGNESGFAFVINGVAAYEASPLYIPGVRGLLQRSVGFSWAPSAVRFFGNGRFHDDTATAASISASTSSLGFLGEGPSGGALFLDAVAVAFVFARNISDARHAELNKAPYQLFKPRRAIIYSLPAAGGGETFDAAVTGAGTTTGALTASIQPAAAVSASGTTVGALTTDIQLATAVAGAGTTTGALTVTAQFDAAVSAAGTTTGALTTDIQLATAVAGAGATTGALTVATQFAASAAASGSASATMQEGAVIPVLSLPGVQDVTATSARPRVYAEF